MAAAGIAALLALTACSKAGGSTGTPSGSQGAGPRPSTTAKLAILSPTNGQTIHGSNVALRVSLQGARIVPSTTANVVPDQGHIHVYVDDAIVSMTFGLRQVIPNVSPGQHVLRVEFVASDHLPFDPRLFQSVVFTVTP
jgi:Family of unknown function (DUF6130)